MPYSAVLRSAPTERFAANPINVTAMMRVGGRPAKEALIARRRCDPAPSAAMKLDSRAKAKRLRASLKTRHAAELKRLFALVRAHDDRTLLAALAPRQAEASAPATRWCASWNKR